MFTVLLPIFCIFQFYTNFPVLYLWISFKFDKNINIFCNLSLLNENKNERFFCILFGGIFGNKEY